MCLPKGNKSDVLIKNNKKLLFELKTQKQTFRDKLNVK